MARRKANTKKNNQPCRMPAIRGGKYCYSHSPELGVKRAQSRKKGGANRRVSHHGDSKSIPQEIKTLDDANKILIYTLAEVIPMENSISRGRLLIALYEAFLKSFEIGELEQRIAALEQRRSMEPYRASRRMGNVASLEKRVDDLEQKFQPTTKKIVVMILGEGGSVQFGSSELIGKTSKEVDALYSDGVAVIHVNREDTE